MMNPFVLGTAQLGSPYGIANRTGKPDLKEAIAIVKVAWDEGLREFDTAQAYGESETVLGICFKELGLTSRAEVISKFNPESDSLQTSLEKLGVKRLHALLLHSGRWLSEWEGRWKKMFRKFKEVRLIRHAGVSVYSSEDCARALEAEGLDCIQLPFNIFDRRALREGWFEKARERNKKIFVRSVYLQGLLLMTPNQLPPAMAFAKPYLETYRLFCARHHLSQQEAALGFVLRHAGASPVIIGAETSQQVRQNVALIKNLKNRSILDEIIFDPENWDEKLIHPSLW